MNISMDAPKISVLLPAYNAASTLASAVESLLSQTLREIEIVIVENGSSDATHDVALALAKQDKRVKILRLPSPGIVPALNEGIKNCRAPLVARMDADDHCDPNRLELQYKFLERHPEIGLVATRVSFGGDPNTHGGLAAYVDWTNTLIQPIEIASHRFVESPVVHPSVVMRKELLEKHGNYRDGDFPEDYELWLRLLDAGVKMAKLPELLVSWNDSSTRLTRVDPRYSTDYFFACKNVYLAKWLQSHVAQEREIYAWGAGKVARQRVLELEPLLGKKIQSWIDIDEKKCGEGDGNKVDGKRIIYYEELKTLTPKPFVLSVVSTRGAREKIAEALESMNYKLSQDYLLIG